MRRRTALATFILTAAVAAPAQIAWADEDGPYRIDWGVDLPIFGVSLAAASAASLEMPPPPCLPRCSRDGINALDRTALGRYSPTATRSPT